MDTTATAAPAQAQTMTTKDWVITILITALPLIGLIMLFVWAFGSGTNQNKANWAKAMLIWALIAIVLSFIFSAIFGTAILAGMGGSQGF